MHYIYIYIYTRVYIYSNRRSRSCSSSYREKLSSVRIVSTSVCTQPHCSRRGTRYVVRAIHNGPRWWCTTAVSCQSVREGGEEAAGARKSQQKHLPPGINRFYQICVPNHSLPPTAIVIAKSLSAPLLGLFSFFFFSTPRLDLPSSSPLVAIASWKVSEAKGGASRKRFQKSFPFSKRGEKIASIERERREQKTCPRAVCLVEYLLLLEGKKKRWLSVVVETFLRPVYSRIECNLARRTPLLRVH